MTDELSLQSTRDAHEDQFLSLRLAGSEPPGVNGQMLTLSTTHKSVQNVQ